MLGKKPIPVSPFTLQVLTTDYLIEGTTDGNTELNFSDSDPLIHLTSVQIHSVRIPEHPVQTCSHFSVARGTTTVAYIPRKEVSQMLKYRIWEKYQKQLQGTFYAGPYIIRGTLMALRDNYFEPEMPLFDAHITCLTAGTSWDDLPAPFVLLNRQWLIGYQPD